MANLPDISAVKENPMLRRKKKNVSQRRHGRGDKSVHCWRAEGNSGRSVADPSSRGSGGHVLDCPKKRKRIPLTGEPSDRKERTSLQPHLLEEEKESEFPSLTPAQ